MNFITSHGGGIGGYTWDNVASNSSATLQRLMTLDGSGHLSLPLLPTSASYANDGAAATGGVAVGQFYRNGSQVMVRVT